MATELWHRTFGTPAGRVSCPSADFSQTVVWIRDAASNDDPNRPSGSARAPKRDCGAQSSGGHHGPGTARGGSPELPGPVPVSGGSTRPARRSPLARSDRERFQVCRKKKTENIRRVRRRRAQFRQLNNSRRLRCTAVRRRLWARHGGFQKPGGRVPRFPCFFCFPSLTSKRPGPGSTVLVPACCLPAPASQPAWNCQTVQGCL